MGLHLLTCNRQQRLVCFRYLIWVVGCSASEVKRYSAVKCVNGNALKGERRLGCAGVEFSKTTNQTEWKIIGWDRYLTRTFSPRVIDWRLQVYSIVWIYPGFSNPRSKSKLTSSNGTKLDATGNMLSWMEYRNGQKISSLLTTVLSWWKRKLWEIS